MSTEVIRQEHARTRQGVFLKEGTRSVTIVLQPSWEWPFRVSSSELKAGHSEVQDRDWRNGVSSSIVAFSYIWCLTHLEAPIT